MRKGQIGAAVTIAAVIVAGVVIAPRTGRSDGLTVVSAAVTRGPIVEVVRAMGTLQPVETVAVGAQVSGRIAEILTDFSDLVRRGQVLARLDPTLIQAQVDQARTALVRAQAERERVATTLADAQVKLTRARELWDTRLATEQDRDAAITAVRVAEAQLRSADAQVGQAQAALDQREVDLDRAVIRAPIDGFVLSREVEVGQTVAARVEAPTLFVLAADLTAMQILVQVPEDDIGRVQEDQPATFSVDAYVGETFTGRITQVRLTPAVERGVVRYPAVIEVENPDLKLTPGMTAGVTMEVGRRDDAVLVPAAALRFEPTEQTFEALGQEPPQMSMAPGDEEDAEEGPGPGQEPPGAAHEDVVWRLDEGDQLTPVEVLVGISDDDNVELVEGDLEPGDEVVTRVLDPDARIRPAPTLRTRSIFAPPRGRPYR